MGMNLFNYTAFNAAYAEGWLALYNGELDTLAHFTNHSDPKPSRSIPQGSHNFQNYLFRVWAAFYFFVLPLVPRQVSRKGPFGQHILLLVHCLPVSMHTVPQFLA